MDDLHLEADRIFGPCNDPTCPGSRSTVEHAHASTWTGPDEFTFDSSRTPRIAPLGASDA